MGRPRKVVNNPNPVIRTGISQCGMELVDSTINQDAALAALAETYRAEGLPVPDQARLLAELQGAR